jgi:hypothetical protein
VFGDEATQFASVLWVTKPLSDTCACLGQAQARICEPILVVIRLALRMEAPQLYLPGTEFDHVDREYSGRGAPM